MLLQKIHGLKIDAITNFQHSNAKNLALLCRKSAIFGTFSAWKCVMLATESAETDF